MSGALQVWVTAPGDTCLIDNHEWRLKFADPHGRPLSWGGLVYSDLKAPSGYWSGTLPVGRLVAVASRTGESGQVLETYPALAEVACTGSGCLFLMVRPESDNASSTSDSSRTKSKGKKVKNQKRANGPVASNLSGPEVSAGTLSMPPLTARMPKGQ
jgi:hypothetical protein